jgi:hypothetical protein
VDADSHHGFRHLGHKNDHAIIAAEAVVYDALYAYCQEMVCRGKLDGQFRGLDRPVALWLLR